MENFRASELRLDSSDSSFRAVIAGRRGGGCFALCVPLEEEVMWGRQYNILVYLESCSVPHVHNYFYIHCLLRAVS